MTIRRALFALAPLACAATAFAAPELFPPEPAEAGAAKADGPRSRTVRIDVDAFEAAMATGELDLAFFADARWKVAVDDATEFAAGGFLSANVPGDAHGSLLLARRGEAFAGDLKLGDGSTWTIRPTTGGLHVVAERFADAEMPCGGALTPPGPLFAARGPVPAATDSAEIVDVVVAWTTEARKALGGTDGMLALVDLAIARANHGYANSMVTQRVALVGTAELGSYVDNTRTPGTVLGHFATPGDGFLEGIHALRDYHRADCAALIVEELTGACGIAYQLSVVDPSFAESAFSATDRDCISNETFHHELGHNMGCHHDRANAGSVPFPYSYGWLWNGTSAGNPLYRSVMAFAPASGPAGIRVNHFSNPDVQYDGAPTGVAIGLPNAAHNAATLDATAATVANFRISNDRFADAIAIDPARRRFATSTHGRGKETGEPDHAGNAGGRSLWWSWTATQDGPILLTTEGSAVDTLLAVYAGDAVDALTPVAANDDASELESWSTVLFQGVAGTTYRIAVDGKSGAQGPIAFDLFVQPEIGVQPEAVFAETRTLANPADSAFDVAGGGLGTLEWSVSESAPWLSAAPASGTGDATVAISWHADGLEDGIYATDIVVSSPDAGNSPRTVAATLEVLREPTECALLPVPTGQASTGANRGRGNVLSVESPVFLREIRASLFAASPTAATVRWNVLEGAEAGGPFVGIFQKDTAVAPAATPTLVSSGYANVLLTPGKFYAVVASWNEPILSIPVDGGNPTAFDLGTVHFGVSGGFPWGSYVGLSIAPTTNANRYRMEYCFVPVEPTIEALEIR